MATPGAGHEASHPSPAKYAAIAVILSVITAVEVWVVYVEALAGVLLPILAVLSITKFALVGMFYMHLKFDSRLFSAMFVGGIILTVGIIIALMGLFQVFVD